MLNSPTNSSVCMSMNARLTTATMAAKLCGACSIWDTRPGLFRRRRAWSGYKELGIETKNFHPVIHPERDQESEIVACRHVREIPYKTNSHHIIIEIVVTRNKPTNLLNARWLG